VPSDDLAELRRVIGSNIRLARRLAGMSQERLLAEVDHVFVRQQLSTWENGRQRPGDVNLIRIGRATGQTLGWFYEPHDKSEG